MEEEYSVEVNQLLEAASDFAFHPGVQSEASVKDFLDRFPLPSIISALQTGGDVPGLENALTACLERIFTTKYGASLIPQYLSFVVIGLEADSQKVRCLACKTVSCLLENFGENTISAPQLVIDYGIYPLLLKCLIDGDEQVATASMDAIKDLAGSTEGMAAIFPVNKQEATHLRNFAAGCSSLARVRVLALVVKLFSISSSVAAVVYNSNLLNLIVEEVNNVEDTLVSLSVLELLYELAEIRHGTEFLSKTTLLQLLNSMISKTSAESILRARAMMIIGRLMSKENAFMYIDESSIKNFVSAIGGRLGSLESQDADEYECAIEALGQIGLSIQGAQLLLKSPSPAIRHVMDAAFDWHGRGKQLAALHALGNISGETRPENNRMLNVDEEESLRILIYETASRTSKLTPSGLFMSVLQQEPEFRLAGYRLITGMVSRPWCLMEICSRQEIIDVVTDTYTETNKLGMEARHKCCQAILTSLTSSNKLSSDPALTKVAEKLDEAVRRGPYLAKRQPGAQPAVMTAERF